VLKSQFGTEIDIDKDTGNAIAGNAAETASGVREQLRWARML
jgi:hypothetical protein